MYLTIIITLAIFHRIGQQNGLSFWFCWVYYFLTIHCWAIVTETHTWTQTYVCALNNPLLSDSDWNTYMKTNLCLCAARNTEGIIEH